MSDQSPADRRIHRLSRVYAAASRINSLIVRSQDVQTLFTEACRVAVVEGGLRMAWVGRVGDDGQALRPVAQYGDDLGYLDSIRVSVIDEPAGRGPSGVAFRTGAAALCNDTLSDPSYALWRDHAIARGYRSSAAFPLSLDARPVGVLAIYCDSPGFFDDEEVRLFQSLADNLSFALEAQQREARRAQVETDLRESELRLRGLARQLEQERARLAAAQEVAKVGSWETDLTHGTVSWSQETYRIFEIDADRFGGSHESFLAYVHPADRQRVNDAFMQSFEASGPSTVEHRIAVPGDRVKFVEERWQVYRDAAGKPLRALGTCQDVTARRQLEEAQFNSRQTLLAVLDSIPQRVFWKDRDLIYQGCNRPFAADMGFASPAQVVGKSDFDASWKASADSYRAIDRRVIESGEPQLSFEEQLVRPDGEQRWLRTNKVALRNREGEVTGVLGTYEDITEARRLQQQFLRAQRLESIGTLAGGIAHDLNNALSPILLAVALLKEDETNPKQMDLLTTIESGAARGADMVRQVLSFARGVESQQSPIDVAPIVRAVEKIANETFMKTIQVRTHIPRGEWVVSGDPTQLHQVLMNLCVNARDAMPGGGVLTLSVAHLDVDEQLAALPGASPGRHVVLAIADTGMGIAPEVADKIFDPFFTTKEVGKGTGLGLSTSQAIVKAHGGFIRVHSELGKGTTFEICLPAWRGQAGDLAVDRSALPRGHGERVLVIDDEASVRMVTRLTLEKFGYVVLEAADGAEGVSVYAQRRDAIAAVIVDMMMPVMNGPATIEALLKLDPRVRIIATSGVSQGRAPLGAAGGEVQAFLAKPYSPEALLRAVAALVGGPATT
ncbi:MAG: ATP-binding protein [Vicinamibacterales bacterium]